MTGACRTGLVIVLSVFLSGQAAQQGFAYEEESRTVHRTVSGLLFYPDWILNKPDHYEFTPLVSNHDPQNQHPAAWDGQDWETSQWGSKWTPEEALQRFFRARIFQRQYMGSDNMPVVEVGPTFYKLSDLDQRRTLKLLTEHTAIFQKGYNIIGLVDWSTHDMVGTYTPKGMFLN